MFNPEKDDDIVTCPYNSIHRMQRKRLQPHLVQCRLSFPDAEMLKCPFNLSHLVPEPEFHHHVSICPDKDLIAQYKYNQMPAKVDEEDRKQIVVDCAENWDDTDAPDYDPLKYVSEAKVIRSNLGCTTLPSTRAAFRKEERKRLGDYVSSDEEDDKKKVYKDYDCMVKQEKKESGWFLDTDGASTSKFPRNHENDRESDRRSVKTYSSDRLPEKRPVKREKPDPGEYTKRVKTEEAYDLDEDPYYRSNNSGRGGFSSFGRGERGRWSRGSGYNVASARGMHRRYNNH